MKLPIVLIVAGLLAGCGVSDEERQAMHAKLPPGCKMYELGEYGTIRNLVIVRCRREDSISANWIEPNGKYSKQQTSVTVEE